MRRSRLWISILVASLFFVLSVPSSQAQTAEFVVINHVATNELADTLGLNVFFTLTDASGRPLPRANFESATIQLLGSDQEPVPASIEDPQTPVFIALLMDGSGSMQPVIDAAREAARSAIDAAPPTAHFAVIQFNEASTIIENFTNDLNLVKAAINVVDAVPNRGTCLYDATFDAVRLLDRQIQNPEQRRAIILFTDGKDQLTADNPEPCSRHTYEDVINAARPATLFAPITPIHTIGLFDDQGDNLNESELRGLATDTIAFSAIGNQTNLGSLFREIIDGLSSQLVARANVFANQGENQAVLSVKLRDREAPLTTTFSFFSNTDYDLPPPPVNLQISSLQYDAAEDIYLLSLSVTGPESLLQIVVGVWDVRRGVQVSADQFFDNPGETVLAELGTESFEAEREYSIHIQAIDKEGFLVQNEDGETLLAEREIVYEPPQSEPIEFTVQSVNADFENGLLLIDLDVPEAGRVQTYEGFILDESTGGRIHDFGPAPFAGNRIQETLPEAIQSAEVVLSYRVTVYLTTQEQLRSEASFDDFKPIPPEPPGLMTRVVEALSGNPAIVASIVVILLAITFWLIFRGQSKKKQEVVIPRPPVDKTMIFADSGGQSGPSAYDDWFPEEDELLSPEAPGLGSATMRVQVRVVQSPGQAPALEKILTTFPGVVGREGCDINITYDRRVSRRHMEISVSGTEILITDLGSRNGTHIGGTRLAPNTPTPLGSSKVVRLGSQTHLEIEAI
jgi:hypothetical protein